MLGAQDWYCIDRDCVNVRGRRSVLGRIVKGELVIDGVKANTDGTHLTVICPGCATPKTWFAADKKVVSEFWTVMNRTMSKLMGVVENE